MFNVKNNCEYLIDSLIKVDDIRSKWIDYVNKHDKLRNVLNQSNGDSLESFLNSHINSVDSKMIDVLNDIIRNANASEEDKLYLLFTFFLFNTEFYDRTYLYGGSILVPLDSKVIDDIKNKKEVYLQINLF